MSQYIADPLTCIINKILESGKIPPALKATLIIPLYKSADKCPVKNYRPISLITNLSKILESVIHYRLNKFKILSKRHFGFKRDPALKMPLLKSGPIFIMLFTKKGIWGFT